MTTQPRTGLDWLQTAARRLSRFNVEIAVATAEAIKFANAQAAEAVTIADDDGATILFRDAAPTISCVLEELAHALQARARSFVDRDAREMRCLREIEAKECLVARRMHYGISLEEDAMTASQLDEERANLRKLREKW